MSATDIPMRDKAFATVQARCALAGITLIKLDGDFGHPVFIVTRWSLTKQFDFLADVDAWLDRVTGKKANTFAPPAEL